MCYAVLRRCLSKHLVLLHGRTAPLLLACSMKLVVRSSGLVWCRGAKDVVAWWLLCTLLGLVPAARRQQVPHVTQMRAVCLLTAAC